VQAAALLAAWTLLECPTDECAAARPSGTSSSVQTAVLSGRLQFEVLVTLMLLHTPLIQSIANEINQYNGICDS
jgi:hypothetical protein